MFYGSHGPFTLRNGRGLLEGLSAWDETYTSHLTPNKIYNFYAYQDESERFFENLLKHGATEVSGDVIRMWLGQEVTCSSLEHQQDLDIR